MFKRALSGAAAAVLLAAGVSASPAHAQSGVGWIAAAVLGASDGALAQVPVDAAEGHWVSVAVSGSAEEQLCSAEYTPAHRGAFLGFASRAGAEYLVYGTFLLDVEISDGQIPEIYAETGNGSVLLIGPPEEMDRVARRWMPDDPLSHLAQLAVGEDQFILKAAGLEFEIPLNGFADAYESMQQCVRENFPVGGSANVPHPPILIAFDGINQLGREASRQRLLSEKLTYTLTVDAQGNPTNCELSRDFRRRATEIALCRPLLRHTRFEPARDENDNPVEGTHSMTVDFDMWMGQDGFLEPEDRD